MKTQVRSLLTLLCAAIATLLILSSPAQAGYIVTLNQVGPNVVATGSGALDLTGLFGGGPASDQARLYPGGAQILTGSSPDSLYFGNLAGPLHFGSGGPLQLATSGAGDLVGIEEESFLLVPQGYVSGTALSSTATWDNATFSSLGVDPGTYEWAWGNGENQNFTLEIHVPDRGSTFGLLALSLIVLLGASRFRFLQSA
jgi:hypothetical protein